jgi:hypothetical protein
VGWQMLPVGTNGCAMNTVRATVTWCVTTNREEKNMKYRIEPIVSDDLDTFRLHVNGPKVYSVLWGMMEEVRKRWKYTDEKETVSWWEVYQFMIGSLADNGIDMDDLK